MGPRVVVVTGGQTGKPSRRWGFAAPVAPRVLGPAEAEDAKRSAPSLVMAACTDALQSLGLRCIGAKDNGTILVLEDAKGSTVSYGDDELKTLIDVALKKTPITNVEHYEIRIT